MSVGGEDNRKNLLNVCVSGLNVKIINFDVKTGFSLPPAHEKFSLPQIDNIAYPYSQGELRLQAIDQKIPPEIFLAETVCSTEIFRVIEKSTGQLIFHEPLKIPQHVISIDKDFQTGQIVGEFSQLNGEPFYPLQHIDIVIFSNWLATFADIILHSAGAAIDGKGYCFIGRSGAGKSTFSRMLSKVEGVTILGEDQVILRYLHDRFWIFGTPWHIDPDYCSPIGVPLEKVFFINRNGTESYLPITPMEGLRGLIPNAFIPFYRKSLVPGIIERLSLLSERIPFVKISFLLDSDPLILIREKQ